MLLAETEEATPFGTLAIEALDRLGIAYDYEEEVGHRQELRILARPRTQCVAQDSKAFCYAGRGIVIFVQRRVSCVQRMGR